MHTWDWISLLTTFNKYRWRYLNVILLKMIQWYVIGVNEYKIYQYSHRLLSIPCTSWHYSDVIWGPSKQWVIFHSVSSVALTLTTGCCFGWMRVPASLYLWKISPPASWWWPRFFSPFKWKWGRCQSNSSLHRTMGVTRPLWYGVAQQDFNRKIIDFSCLRIGGAFSENFLWCFFDTEVWAHNLNES